VASFDIQGEWPTGLRLSVDTQTVRRPARRHFAVADPVSKKVIEAALGTERLIPLSSPPLGQQLTDVLGVPAGVVGSAAYSREPVYISSQVIEPRKHQAIDIADGNPLGRPTPQHIEPKGENFGLQGCARQKQPATAYQINLGDRPSA
jgi:hypothetical protein